MALLDLSLRALYRHTTSGTEEGIFSPQTSKTLPRLLEAQKAHQPCPGLVLRVAALRSSGWPLGSSFPFLKVTHICRLAFLPYEEGSQPSFISCGLCLLWIQTGSICAHKISLLSDRLATSLVSPSRACFFTVLQQTAENCVQIFKFCFFLPSAVCSQVRRESLM